MGVPLARALLFGLCIRAPDFWKLSCMYYRPTWSLWVGYLLESTVIAFWAVHYTPEAETRS